jgi:hypothetical protein
MSVSPPIAAMFAGALANIGVYGLLRFGPAILRARSSSGLRADRHRVGEHRLRGAAGDRARHTQEVLAYSAIGHAGTCSSPSGSEVRSGIAAAVVFSVANSLNKALLFLSSELRGRFVAGAFLLGALSVAGVPPSAGFFGKAALFDAGIDAGSVAVVVLLFVGGRAVVRLPVPDLPARPLAPSRGARAADTGDACGRLAAGRGGRRGAGRSSPSASGPSRCSRSRAGRRRHRRRGAPMSRLVGAAAALSLVYALTLASAPIR